MEFLKWNHQNCDNWKWNHHDSIIINPSVKVFEELSIIIFKLNDLHELQSKLSDISSSKNPCEVVTTLDGLTNKLNELLTKLNHLKTLVIQCGEL